MAFTNAERQARHRARLKAAAGAGHREALRRYYEECLAVDPDITPHGFALDLLPDEYDARDLMAAIILDLLGLDADPWPGLTADALLTMVGKRRREAKQRKIPIWRSGADELDLEDKIRAAAYREWLMSGSVVTNANRPAVTSTVGAVQVAAGG